MSSIDRLLALARTTGDRLIVHDPNSDDDMVIMSLADYEYLILGRKNVHKLSDAQLLDQINRDISVWRSSHKDNDLEDDVSMIDATADALGKKLSEMELSSTWHQASEVIGDHYDKNILLLNKLEAKSENIVDDGNSDLAIDWEEYLPGGEMENLSAQEDKIQNVPNQINVVEIGEIDSPLPEPNEWEEESLDDSPVFYEEPV
jgi:hypothetical protein